MRPTEYLTRQNYPIVVGLAVLLLPYFWSLLVLPFTLSKQLHSRDRFERATTTSISVQSSVKATPSTGFSSSRVGGFRFWKGGNSASSTTSLDAKSISSSTRGRFDIWKKPKTTTTTTKSGTSLSSSPKSVGSIRSTSSAKRLDLWKGIKEVIGPKWE